MYIDTYQGLSQVPVEILCTNFKYKDSILGRLSLLITNALLTAFLNRFINSVC